MQGAINQYAVYPLPYGVIVKWFIFGVISCMIAGLVLTLLFKGVKQAAAA